MEKTDSFVGINDGIYKMSLAKQMEENRRLLENYRRMKEPQKRVERLKQESDSFVCDWQQPCEYF